MEDKDLHMNFLITRSFTCFVLVTHTYICTYLNIIAVVCVCVCGGIHGDIRLPQSMTHHYFTVLQHFSQMSSSQTTPVSDLLPDVSNSVKHYESNVYAIKYALFGGNYYLCFRQRIRYQRATTIEKVYGWQTCNYS